MTLALRPADPLVARVRARTRPDRTNLAFAVGVAAVIAHFVIGNSLLSLLGINSQGPGGNPLVKFHPATYLSLLAAILAITGAPRPGDALARLFADRPGLAAYLVLVPAVTFYAMLSSGIGGSASYVDSFLAAGLLALALETGSDRKRRALGYLILALCLIEVGISIVESVTRSHLIPFVIDGQAMTAETADDFRGVALYDHPLTGALVTSMGVFLLLAMRLRPWITASAFTLLLVGLLSFGGRTALVVTLVLLVGAAIYMLVRGLMMRRLNGGFVAAFLGGLFVLAPLLIILATETSIGARIADHLYFDSSAQVRDLQWRVLDYLTVHDVLFGLPPEAQEVLKAQIGLNSITTDIENCWLLLFLSLGAIVFVVLMAALVLFLWHLGRSGSAIGWLLLIATMIDVSSSNSLGRKAGDLSFLAAFMIASTGFIGYQRPAAAPARRRRVIDLRRHRGLATGPAATASARGLTTLPALRASISLLAGHSTR